MGLLSNFDPPAFLNDFDSIAGQRKTWDTFISTVFDAAVEAQSTVVVGRDGSPGRVQFYNPKRFDPGSPKIEQAIVWNAFPKELLRRFGRERALIEADRTYALRQYRGTSGGTDNLDVYRYRPQVEYCEWHVQRDPLSGAITRVTFTSEPPEYWQALFGDAINTNGKGKVKFDGDKAKTLALYREFVSEDAEAEDLVSQEDIVDQVGNVLVSKGDYNIYNKWNTTHGIVHLCAPPNSIVAEILLGAEATTLYQSRRGQAIVDAQALICCADYGGPDRNSDPTIGATVNSLARLGAYVTLPNPVGLYMDHIDTRGWQFPDGICEKDCVRVARGQPGMIERLVVEVPKDRGFTVSDISIGGEPIRYGGQIAECITVKLVGAAARLGAIDNAPIRCSGRCGIDPAFAAVLDRPVAVGHRLPPGTVPAFAYLDDESRPAHMSARPKSLRHR